jgi:hypothetical protein
VLGGGFQLVIHDQATCQRRDRQEQREGGEECRLYDPAPRQDAYADDGEGEVATIEQQSSTGRSAAERKRHEQGEPLKQEQRAEPGIDSHLSIEAARSRCTDDLHCKLLATFSPGFARRFSNAKHFATAIPAMAQRFLGPTVRSGRGEAGCRTIMADRRVCPDRLVSDAARGSYSFFAEAATEEPRSLVFRGSGQLTGQGDWT